MAAQGQAAECASLAPSDPLRMATLPTAPLCLPQGLLDPKSLEDLTGLTQLHAASEAALEAWEGSDEEEGEGRAAGGGGEDEWCEL